MGMLCTPISINTFHMYNPLFPFSILEYPPVLTIGYFLLHVIFTHCGFGGALSVVLAQCARSATIWAPGRNRNPYFVVLWASLLFGSRF